MNAAGTVLAVGRPGDGNPINSGATWMFAVSGGNWVQNGSKLVGGTLYSGRGERGTSVSLNAAGDMLAVGAVVLARIMKVAHSSLPTRTVRGPYLAVVRWWGQVGQTTQTRDLRSQSTWWGTRGFWLSEGLVIVQT